VATLDDLARLALALPAVTVEDHFGGPSYTVGGRAFALHWRPDDRTIFRLPPHRQELLFEIRPQVFAPVKVGRAVWSYVALDALDLAELEALIIEAWRGVVPKRLGRSIGGEADRSRDQA